MPASRDATNSDVVASPRMRWDAVARSQWHDIRLNKYDPLFRQGAASTHFYRLIDGVMCSHQIFTDGRRQVISFPYPGETIGLTESDIHRFSCDAICDARVRCISKSAFLKYVEGHSDVGLRLHEIVMEKCARARDHQVLLGRKTAMEKVAAFLLMLVQKGGVQIAQGTRIHVPMNRTDIADYLGLTIETVCRNLTKLKAKSIIDVPHSTIVMVCDMDRLVDLGRVEETTPKCWR